MATGKVMVNVADVGQGQCTFVEIFDTDGNRTNTLLFDCGSDKASDQTKANLAAIAKKIRGMRDPKIDCIFFSHSDNDHISLTKHLLEDNFENLKVPFPKIGKVIYGGVYDEYTKRNVNILDWLKEKKLCTKDTIISPGTNHSDYENGKFGTSFWDCDRVKVCSVVANVQSATPDWDEENEEMDTSNAASKNRVSIVCALYCGIHAYVICGDATNVTMGCINGRFENTTVFDNNVMTTMPHHGSRATAFNLPRKTPVGSDNVKVVETFATILKARSYTNSAFEKHRHPSLELLGYFIPKEKTPLLRDVRLKQKNVHRATAYIDIPLVRGDATTVSDDSHTFETDINTFTTRYWTGNPTFSYQIGPSRSVGATEGLAVDTTINYHASWVYEQNADGSALVAGYTALGGTQFTDRATTLDPNADLLLMPKPYPFPEELADPAGPRPAPAAPFKQVEARRFPQRLRTIR